MLDWDNPIRAVKSNLNAIVGSVFTVFLVVVLGIFTFRLARGVCMLGLYRSCWLRPHLE